MRPLTVLNIAFPFAAAGPDAVGGAEQILSDLDYALVAAGHRSIVVAAEGSEVRGKLIPTQTPDGEITDDVRQLVYRRHRENIATALRRYPVDIVHMHGIDFYSYLPPEGVPVLVTLHLPPAWYPQQIWEIGRPQTYLHCVSRTQQAQCPAGSHLLEPIPNGVSVEQFEYHCTRRRYAMALGRICPEKNFHVAMDAAERADVPLLIGGQCFPYQTHLEYLHAQIEPRLNGRIRYLGPLAFARKRRLLSGATCLVSASLAPETSSLVAMEALACGTPVVAFPSGALPEIIEDGVTGFLVANEEEMAAAIARCAALDHEACREAALRRFSLETMISRYFGAYERLARTAIDVRESAPREQFITSTADLESITADWQRLWLRDPNATTFQSPAWLLPWWKHIAEGDLLTYAQRNDTGQLTGLLPMYVYTQASGSRDLFPVGIATTDYLDQIAAPETAAEFSRDALSALMQRRSQWDVIDLQQLRDTSQLLRAATPDGLAEDRSESESCVTLPLPATIEAIATALPWNIVQNANYYRHRAMRHADYRIEAVDQRNVEEAYEALLHLHSVRWSERDEPGVLADAKVQAAHRETIPALLRDDCLRMYVVRFTNRIAAVFYGLADPPGRPDRSIYYYLGGFDPQYRALSPGTLLIAHAIEQATHQGFKTFDFLRGREAYKYRWGAKDRVTWRRQFRPVRVAAAQAQEVLR